MSKDIDVELSQMLKPKDLAARLNVPVETLSNWRSTGMGPAYVKLSQTRNGHVRYQLADVLEWERSLVKHRPAVERNVEAAYGSV